MTRLAHGPHQPARAARGALMPVEYNGAKFAELGERLAAANGYQLKVGVVGPGAAAVEADSDLTMAALALIHEYGTEDGHIPERAPLRSGRTDMAHEHDHRTRHAGKRAGDRRGGADLGRLEQHFYGLYSPLTA